MKTFVVNLDCHPERLAHIVGQCAQRGLTFERIPAVHGASLSRTARRRAFAAFRSWCALGRRLTPGEIGCALSHCAIYRRMVEEKIPAALVFEDDVIIAPAIHERLKDVEAFLKLDRPQVVLLSAIFFDGGEKRGILRNRDAAWGTTGYVITLPAAKRIADANTPVVAEADAWKRWMRHCGVEVYTCWPAVVCQEGAFGTAVNTVPRKRFTGWCKWCHRALRIPQLLVDWCFWILLGK